MSDIVIRCEGIDKRYRLGQRQQYRALRDTLTDALRAPLRRLRAAFGPQSSVDSSGLEFLWALKDITLEVRRGEVLGLIGRNGAGKSTLLKILARITTPTDGQAEIHGRIGSLLEVGTGFHPELTGRENIYLNGAVLGMTRREIARKFDEIVEFSECSRFLDTAVKHFSSGMYMRLAFAVAAHLETEILLVDEVLAVGDAPFQKKCLGKIGDVAHQGRTVLFVSHNLLAVEGLCSRAICLHEGEVALEGPPREVVSRYLQEHLTSSGSREAIFEEIGSAPGNDQIRLRRACVRPSRGSLADPITVRTPLTIEFEYWKLVPQGNLEVGVYVYNEHGIHLFGTCWSGTPPAGLLRSWFVVPGDLLNTGTHRVEFSLELAGGESLIWDNLLVFDVRDAHDLRGLFHGAWPGAVRPNLQWTTEQIEGLPDPPTVNRIRPS